MPKTTHTHTGTCQACGRQQAAANGSNIIAKHGYRVAGFGFFAGVCVGSGKLPAELDLTHTHATIKALTEMAANCDRLEALYALGDLLVISHSVRSGKRDARGSAIYIDVPMFGCSDYYLADRQRLAAGNEAAHARQMRHHVEFLVRNVIPRFGQTLTANASLTKAAPRQFNAGEVVKLAGKDFVLVAPRYGIRGGTTPRYWKGHFVGETQMYTPSVISLRNQNK